MVCILVFSDADGHHGRDHFSFTTELQIYDLSIGSIFNAIAWLSHRAIRPVRSIGAAEILAAGDTNADDKIISVCIDALCNTTITLHIVLDTSDMLLSLSTQRTSVDKSIRTIKSVIRYDIKSRNLAKAS